jgi:hypothetical protein
MDFGKKNRYISCYFRFIWPWAAVFMVTIDLFGLGSTFHGNINYRFIWPFSMSNINSDFPLVLFTPQNYKNSFFALIHHIDRV